MIVSRHEPTVRAYREVLGRRLKEFRESRGISKYRVMKKGDIEFRQVQAVEEGRRYTIDIFLQYLRGCDLYIFFGEKNNTSGEAVDIEDMIGAIRKNDPRRNG